MITLPRVVVIGGMTASGKSARALRLAERPPDGILGELVGADSRQLYAGLPIASAGPTNADRARAPHHLYGAIDPATETLSAGRFIALADEAVASILARGRRAIIVGGTGLYLRALRCGLDDEAPVDLAVRAALRAELDGSGLAPLVARLQGSGHDVAHVDMDNPVRVLRALEVIAGGGAPRPVSSLLTRAPRKIVQDAAWLLVSPAPAVVESAIAARSAAMFEAGIVDEASALARRLSPGHELLQTIGIKEALAVCVGELEQAAAIDAVSLRTRQYAKRQRTWFKREPWWHDASTLELR